MKVLVVNDDGIEAKGLKVLVKHLKKVADVYVVAPLHEQSAKSHSITIKQLFEVVKYDEKTFAVNGTPADCVKFGVHQFGSDFDVVFSGVNDGPNLANDIFYSGTVAGASEAVFNGIPGVAISCGHKEDFDLVERELDMLIQYVLENKLYNKDIALNINFPAKKFEKSLGIMFTKQGNRDFTNTFVEEENGYRNIYEVAQSTHEEDTDMYANLNGFISITPLIMNRTDHEYLKTAK